MALDASIYEVSPTNLIALSILCQGYFAAHDGEELGETWSKLPEDLRLKCKNKRSMTEQPSWWSVIDFNSLKKEIDSFVKEEDKSKLTGLISVGDGTNTIIKINNVKGVYEIIRSALS